MVCEIEFIIILCPGMGMARPSGQGGQGGVRKGGMAVRRQGGSQRSSGLGLNTG